MNISASLLKDFVACRRRAWYRINQPDKSIQTREMLIGTIVHKVIEVAWYDYNKALDVAQAEIDATNLESGQDLIYKCINTFFRQFADHLTGEDEIEKFFKFNYNDQIDFVGKIDRISNGIIYDWKTGGTLPGDINRDVQFMMYYLAYKELYGEEPQAVVYVSLQHGKVYKFKPIEKYIYILKSEILPEVLSGKPIADGLFGYKACDNCAFRQACFKDLGL